MKIVVAMDSLKESMTSQEAGYAVKEGICRVLPEAQVVVKPLADGGEGTATVLAEGLSGSMIETEVEGPYGERIHSVYGYLESNKTAIIEMAAAAGLSCADSAIIQENKRNPMNASTYGVGEMILDALKKGCRNFIIGIGGSATNDGGLGMLTALGYRFLDKEGRQAPYQAKGLEKIASIDKKHVIRELEGCSFRVACDVNNPLCGKQGATYIYGPQKGVDEGMKDILDAALMHFADVTTEYTGRDFREYPGAGAAGGLGFALLSYLDAELSPGIELVMEAVGLENDIKEADLVITGEGRLDGQSMMGKAPLGVARLGKKYNKPVIALAGVIGEGVEKCNEMGIDAFFPILRRIMTAEDAVKKENAAINMANTAEQVIRLFAL